MLKQIPELIDYESTRKLILDDMNPLNVVLLQEVGLLARIWSPSNRIQGGGVFFGLLVFCFFNYLNIF